MNRADKAEELFRSGYNCAQSVFAAFADAVGMTETEAAKIASPFGAGFGKLREVCGAVSGMTLLAGYLSGYDDPADSEGKKALYRMEQKMCGEFEDRHGSIICRELLGLAAGWVGQWGSHKQCWAPWCPPPAFSVGRGEGGWLLEANWVRRPASHPTCESPWKFPSLLWASLCHREDEAVSHPLGSLLQLGHQFQGSLGRGSPGGGHGSWS